MKYGTQLLLVLTTLLLHHCQNSSPTITGHVPENGAVSGIILNTDGVTPAAGARVMIRPRDFLAEPAAEGLGKLNSIKDTVMTSSEGAFSFDTFIENGTYLIEAMSDNDIVIIDSVRVTHDRAITTPPATLQPAGTIKGSVLNSEGRAVKDVFVLAFGIDRFTRVTEDGSFRFTNLGAGTYALRILSLTENYGAFDTSDINVVAADTTDIGIVTLQSDNLPVPQNLTASYDTTTMRVTLCWNRCTVPGVTGYAVFRRIADSNMVFANLNSRYPLTDTDTVMIDSTAQQDDRYEYRVAATGVNHEAGTKSNSVFVTAASYFSVDTSFTLSENEFLPAALPMEIAVSDNGDLYFTDVTNHCVQVFDRTMNFKRRIGEGYLTNPRKIVIDENGRVIVSCVRPLSGPYDSNGSIIDTLESPVSKFYIFNTAGGMVDSITDTVLSRQRIIDFDAKDSLVYLIEYNSTGYSVSIYTYSGTRLRSWFQDVNWIQKILKGRNDQLFLGYSSDSNYGINLYDTLGTLVSQQYAGRGLLYDMAYDESNNQLYLLLEDYYIDSESSTVRRTTFQVYDENYQLKATMHKDAGFSTRNYSNFHLSGNGETVIFYNPYYYYTPELIRCNPLNN